jgi:hypothetical protein
MYVQDGVVRVSHVDKGGVSDVGLPRGFPYLMMSYTRPGSAGKKDVLVVILTCA